MSTGAGAWTVVFAYYCLLVHLLVFSCPVRACWAIWDLTSSLRKAAQSRVLSNSEFDHNRRSSSSSLSNPETPISSTARASSDASGLKSYSATDTDILNSGVVHAIVIPNYKEEVDSLRETLDVLASHAQARSSYDIFLAMEQREPNAEVKATSIISEFVEKFRSIDFTLHPSNIPNEYPGKGSNVDWAARKLSEKYPVSVRRDVMVTEINADSHLSSNYFALVTAMHLAYPETATTTLYAAPIIFDRNANRVPAVVRVADILWCAAGISGLYRGSTIAPPTSVYSLSLQLVDLVGGWDRECEAIGEDLHMYLKCFFALNGNLTVRTVLSPVSQTNVTSGGYGKGFKGTLSDVGARSYSTSTLVAEAQQDALVYNNKSGDSDDVTRVVLKGPNYMRLLFVFHRLFEAHFLSVHMTILVIASALFKRATGNAEDIHHVGWIFEVCNYLRMGGFMEVTFYLFLYESFHEIAVSAREKEMNEAGLAKGMNFSHRSLKHNFFDYIMVPLVAPLYGSIPSAQAQICHFWRTNLVYTVSKKVTRQRTKPKTEEAIP